MSPPIHPPNQYADDAESETSSVFGYDAEVPHAAFKHVSPRTRRNPGVSLQEFLGTAPAARVGVVVVPNTSRHSVEAIVMGPLLAAVEVQLSTVVELQPVDDKQAQPVGSNSDSSHDSLSRSSSASEPDGQPITPHIPIPEGLASPVELRDPRMPSPPLVDTPETSSTCTSTRKPLLQPRLPSPCSIVHVYLARLRTSRSRRSRRRRNGLTSSRA